MTHDREAELKFMIRRRRDYLSLRDDPRWGSREPPVRQANHYFDTQDLALARAGVLLRIRETNRCVLTLKCGIQVEPGFFDSLEIESVVPREVLVTALESPPSLLGLDLPPIAELGRRFPALDLVVAGTLENERARRVVEGIVLEIDRLSFPDGTQSYELEIETEDRRGVAAWVETELSKAGIRLEPQPLTKFEQLLEWRSRKESGPRTGPSEGDQP